MPKFLAPKILRHRAVFVRFGALALFLAGLAPGETENAIANGDTRTLHLYHAHTRESIDATFRVNGHYDAAVLEKLNWFLRDWRRDEPTKMDPRLFDVVWETYRESGSQQPIEVVSAYRSPETNSMLRHRSRAVAEFSQHMLGKAMDMHYMDVPMSRVREIAMRLQRGGVGYYPTAGTPFVHLDVGSVRAWPRMSYDQLAHLFPDGKTVHLPTNGHPLARYEEARAEVEARNGISLPTETQVKSKGFFASLFGSRDDDEEQATTVATNNHPGERSPNAPRVGGDARVAGFIERSRTSNSGVGARYAAAEASTASMTPDRGSDDDSNAGFFRGSSVRTASQTPAAAPATRPVAAPTPVAPPNIVASMSLGATPTPAQASPPPPPMPPRRPTDLALVAAAAVPLPPSRPVEFMRVAAVAAGQPLTLTRGVDLPSVITTGSSTNAPVAASADAGMPGRGILAYASSATRSISAALTPPVRPMPARPAAAQTQAAPQPVGARTVGLRTAARDRRKPELVAAHLDRSNFRLLTDPADVARATPAPAATGLRAAAQGDVATLVFAAPSGIAAHFDDGANTALSSTGFAGPAVRALPRLETAAL